MRCPVLLVLVLLAGTAGAAAAWQPVTAAQETTVLGTVVRSAQRPAPLSVARTESLPATAAAWAGGQRLEATCWRGLVIAEPEGVGDLWQRLSQGVREPYRARLFRPWDDGSATDAADYPLVFEAMRVLYQRQSSAEATASLANAACWMAGPELTLLLDPLVGEAQGTLPCRSVPRAEFERMLSAGGRSRDQCSRHLLLQMPLRAGAPDTPLVLHGPEHDPAESWLREKRGTIPVSEYRRRVLAAAATRQDAFASGEARWQTPITLDAGADAATLLRKVAEGAGIPLSCPATGGPQVYVDVCGAPAGDLARAVARLAGWSLNRRQGGEWVAAPAQGPREEFTAALPLPLWAAAALTPVEQELFLADAVQEFWGALGVGKQAALAKEPLASTTLERPARAARVRALALECAARLRPWLRNLPDRDLKAAFALYESDQHNFLELAGPTVSEVVQGIQYIALKARWSGTGVLVHKVTPRGETGKDR